MTEKQNENQWPLIEPTQEELEYMERKRKRESVKALVSKTEIEIMKLQDKIEEKQTLKIGLETLLKEL